MLLFQQKPPRLYYAYSSPAVTAPSSPYLVTLACCDEVSCGPSLDDLVAPGSRTHPRHLWLSLNYTRFLSTGALTYVVINVNKTAMSLGKKGSLPLWLSELSAVVLGSASTPARLFLMLDRVKHANSKPL